MEGVIVLNDQKNASERVTRQQHVANLIAMHSRNQILIIEGVDRGVNKLAKSG